MMPSTSSYIESTAASDTNDDEFYMSAMSDILGTMTSSLPPIFPVRITEHVFMGSQRNADDIELLGSLGITHVLNCAGLRRYDFTRSPYPKYAHIKGFLMISAEV